MKLQLSIIGMVAAVFTSFLIALFVQHARVDQLQHENYNLSVALDSLHHEKFNDSLNYATQEAYHAKDIYELREMLTEAENDAVKSLGVKRKDITAVSVTSSRTAMEIQLPIRDTISRIDTIRLPVNWHYHDQWTDVAIRDSMLAISTRDSLMTVCSAVYRHKFLWWRWGLKGYNVSLVNFNPHSAITYNKYIHHGK